MEGVSKTYAEYFGSQELIRNSEEFFRQRILARPGFLYESVAYLFAQNGNNRLIRLMTTVLRSQIRTYWTSMLCPDIEKDRIRNLIASSLELHNSRLAMMNAIAEILCEMVKLDGWEIYESMFNHWYNFAIDSETYEVHMALVSVMITVVERVDDKASAGIALLLQTIYKIFLSDEADVKLRTKVIVLLYLCFKSATSVEHTHPQLFLDFIRPTVVSWTSVFSMVLSTTGPNTQVMKLFAIKTLSIIFRDAKPIAAEVAPQVLPHVWKLFFMSCKEFVETRVLSQQTFKNMLVEMDVELEETYEFDDEKQALIIATIDLMNYVGILITLQAENRASLPCLLWNSLLLLMMTKEDESLWIREPDQYVIEEEEEMSHSSIRNAVLACLSTHIDRFDADAIAIILDMTKYALGDRENDFESKVKTGIEMLKSHKVDVKALGYDPIDFLSKNKKLLSWRLVEAGLLVLHSFVQDVIGYLSQKNKLDENVFAGNILQVLRRSENQIVTGRALWALGSLRYLNNVDDGFFLQIYAMVADYLQPSSPLSLRLCASKTVTIMSYKIASKRLQEIFRNFFGIQIQEYFKSVLQLSRITSDLSMGQIVDNVLSFFDIDPSLLNVFITRELSIYLLTIYHRMWQHVIVGSCLTDIFKRILKSYSAAAQFFPVFWEYIFTQLPREADDQEKTEKLTFLIDLLIFASKESVDFSPIVHCIDHLEFLATRSKLPSVVSKITILFKQLLLRTSRVNLSVSQIEKACKNTFIRIVDPKENESLCVYVGGLGLALYTANNESRNSEFISALVRKMAKSCLPATNQGLTVFFAYQLLQNFDQMLEFLSNLQIEARFGLKVLFDHWLLHQPKFIGPRTKLLTLKALIKILSERRSLTDKLHVVGFKPSHSNKSAEVLLPLKIVSLLAGSLEHERKQLRRKLNKNLDAEQMANRYIEECGDDQRLETEFEDDYGETRDYQNDDMQVDIDMHMSEDEDDNMGDGFGQTNQRNGGLAGIETGSQSYMSGLLGFDDMEGDEIDESTEADLELLGIEKSDLLSYLQTFLQSLQESPYFATLSRGLDKPTLHIISVANLTGSK